MSAVAERIERESREKRDRKRDAFMARYAEWLRLRAEDHDPSRRGDDAVDFRRGERITEPARLICIAPAVLPWMVLIKIEVLELGQHGTTVTATREVTMLGGIKADLVSYGLNEAPSIRAE